MLHERKNYSVLLVDFVAIIVLALCSWKWRRWYDWIFMLFY